MFRFIPRVLAVSLSLILTVAPQIVLSADAFLNFDSGIWRLSNNTDWYQVHQVEAEHLAVGDIDGNGITDAVVSFDFGVWRLMNNSSWQLLHESPARALLIADIDGSGKDDVVVSFDFGLWTWMDNAYWNKMSDVTPDVMAAGDLDGNGKMDLAMSFDFFGLWAVYDSSLWEQLSQESAVDLTAADIDGNGSDDLVVSFEFGVWVILDTWYWQQLNGYKAIRLASGDLDGNGVDDVISVFDFGIWDWMNNDYWQQLYGLPATELAVGDLDDNGTDDVVLSFDFGTWSFMGNSTWTSLNESFASAVAVARTKADVGIEATDVDGCDESGEGFWSPEWAALECEVLRITNEWRANGAQCGAHGWFPPVPPLAMNPNLRLSARTHSKWMGDKGQQQDFSHNSPGGPMGDDPWERMENAGYIDWFKLGENIAAGFQTSLEVMDAWIDSDLHCINVMDPDFREIGVGYAQKPGSYYGIYWTQDFGTRQ
ncbi:MAG: CAP domain-containing protein [Chromatiaceae bacterium]|nr:CAP domain-containing protein [Chromatiaceae bacterium]